MTFFSAGSYGWIIRARAFVLGAGRRRPGTLDGRKTPPSSKPAVWFAS
jgi:hypothetical protein